MTGRTTSSAEPADPDQRDGDETAAERLNRNWGDLLQELRVVQTGVQLLTGFLLTLPFQSRFADIESFQRDAYLITVGCAIAATGFLIAPVSLHRFVFRRHLRDRMVNVGHHFALIGIALLACAIIGVVLLTFSLVSGDTSGLVAAGVAAGLILVLWLVVPLHLRNHSPASVISDGPVPEQPQR
jgi:uncharacterized protein DUF6328